MDLGWPEHEPLKKLSHLETMVPRFRGFHRFHRFRGFHRNEGLVGSGSGSDGSGYEGSVSFEGSVVQLFRCSVGSVLQLFRCFHYVRTRTSSSEEMGRQL